MLVIIISGNENKEKAILGLMFSLHTTIETRVILFGPSEKLAAENDKDILNMINQLIDKGNIPVACTNYAENNKISDELLKIKLILKPVGPLISDYIKDGYVPITF